MLRRLLFPVALLAVALATVASGYASTRATPKLVGISGPGFTITVKTAAGKAVKILKAGSTQSRSRTSPRSTTSTYSDPA